MKNLKHFLALVLLLTASVVGTFASTDSLIVRIISNPPTVSGCDDPTEFTVMVKDSGTATYYHDSINILLESGIYWYATDGPIVDSTPDFPKFYIDSIVGGDSVIFHLWVRGYCSIIGEGTHIDTEFVNYIHLTGPGSYTLIDSFNIVSPYLFFEGDPSLLQYAYYGEHFRRQIPIRNTGSFRYVDGQIAFRDSSGPALRIDTIWAAYGIDTFATVYPDSTVGIDTLYFPDTLGVDSIFYIIESVSVIGCLDSAHLSTTYYNGDSYINIDWGCADAYCQPLPTIQAYIYRNNLRPSPTFTVNPYNDSLCEGSTKPWHLRFTNSSVVEAKQFSFELYPVNYQYSLIDTHTISLTYDTSLIHLDSSHVQLLDVSAHYYSNNCYSAVNYNPLYYIQYFFSSLKNTDTLDFFYTTYKCCANDSSTLNRILADQNSNYYVFDEWSIYMSWEDECNAFNDLPSNLVTPDIYGYLQLTQDFLPLHSDMDAGDNDNFYITNTFYSTDLPDSFYRDFQGGQLAVSFLLDTGLVYYNNSCFIINYDDSDTLRQDSVSLRIDSLTSYNDTIVTVYFPLDTFPNLSALDDFLIDSKINFNLYAYCKARTPFTRYTVTTFLINSSCSDCAIPLNQQTDSLAIHCKGCRVPGWIATHYSLSRISKGWKDDDNNGILDAGKTPATDSLIDHQKAMVGDILIGTLTANLYGGETDTTGGITLSNLDTFLHDSLRFCYLYTTIVNAPTLRILDVAVVITYDSLSHIVTDSIGGMSLIVSQNDSGEYLYDLSLSTLHMWGFAGYLYYSPHDLFKIITKYRVDSNFTNENPGYEAATIDNWIWLTGIENTLTHNPYTNYTEAGTPYTSLTDSSLYWCEAYGGLFYFYAVNIFNGSTFNNTIYESGDYCLKYAKCWAYADIGGSDNYDHPNHVFPFEFRQPPLVDTIKFILPTGYHIDSAKGYYTFPYFVQPSWYWHNYYGDTISWVHQNADTFYYAISPYYTYLDSIVDSLPTHPPYPANYFSKDSIYIADEYFDYALDVFISPICNLTADTTSIIDTNYRYYNILPTMVFSDTAYHFLGADSIIRVAATTSTLEAEELILPSPYYELIPTPSLITADERYNCWTFYIKNTSTFQTMDNVWASIYSPSGHIVLDSAYYNSVALSVNMNGIIDMTPLINPQKVDTFKICVHYTCISTGAEDSMKLFYGWNCFDYPVSLSQSTLCNINDTWLKLKQDTAFLQANFDARDTASNCENTQFQLVVRAPAGNVYDFTAQIILPLGVTYDSGCSKLVYPNGDTTSTIGPHISGDTLRWNLDSTSTALRNNGIGDGDSLKLLFCVSTHCIYDGSPFHATVTGISFCGDNLAVNAETSPITVTNCYSPLSAIIVFTYNDPCYGYSVGETEIAASGGTSPYTYLWNPLGDTLAEIDGLTAGTYIAAVTDSNGCIATATATITQPDSITSIPTIIEACGADTGSIVLTTSGGMPGYIYFWNGSAIPSLADSLYSLAMGYDSVTIQDANGCVLTIDSIHVPGPLHLTTGSLEDTCHIPPIHTGAVWVNVTGGTPGYSYYWDVSTGPQTTDTATGLIAGPYYVTVTDTQGCTATASSYVKTGDPSCPLPSGDSTINGGTLTTSLWLNGASRKYIVLGTINIPPGKSLTVNGASGHPCTLEFAPDAMLVVERGSATQRGAALDIKCGKLTGWDDCSWAGIDVQGYNNIIQDSSQGYFTYAESIIENARSAIYVGNRIASVDSQRYWTGGIIAGDYGGEDPSGYGPGVFTYFHNNTMSITFPAPYPYQSASYIRWSNFYSDSNLPDPCYSRPLWFIKVDSTNGMQIARDSFSIYNNGVSGIDYNVQDSAYGILDTNSYFKTYKYYGFQGLSKCFFLNVNRAIDITFTANQDSEIYINRDTIQYSEMGINLTNGFNNIVRYNTITDIPIYYDANNVYGIITDSTQNIYIRDNTIDSVEYGITVNNSQGNYESRIWNNTISNCTGYGIGTGGNNSNGSQTQGLTVYCNSITNNTIGWNCYNDISSFSVPEQGQCANNLGDFPPANYFNNNFADIYNPYISTGFQIKYNVEFGSTSDYRPNATSYATGGLIDSCSSIPPNHIRDSVCGGTDAEAKNMQEYNDSSFSSVPWLGNAYPNPLNSFTAIPYYLPINTSSAEIDIFDILGNVMSKYSLTKKGMQVILDVNCFNYSGGVYFCIMIVDNNKVGWKKLVVIK